MKTETVLKTSLENENQIHTPEEAVSLFYENVVAICYYLTGCDIAAAESVAHDTYVRLFLKWERAAKGKEEVKKLLYSYAGLASHKYYRKKYRGGGEHSRFDVLLGRLAYGTGCPAEYIDTDAVEKCIFELGSLGEECFAVGKEGLSGICTGIKKDALAKKAGRGRQYFRFAICVVAAALFVFSAVEMASAATGRDLFGALVTVCKGKYYLPTDKKDNIDNGDRDPNRITKIEYFDDIESATLACGKPLPHFGYLPDGLEIEKLRVYRNSESERVNYRFSGEDGLSVEIVEKSGEGKPTDFSSPPKCDILRDGDTYRTEFFIGDMCCTVEYPDAEELEKILSEIAAVYPEAIQV